LLEEMDWKEMTENQNIKGLSIGVSSFTEYKRAGPEEPTLKTLTVY